MIQIKYTRGEGLKLEEVSVTPPDNNEVLIKVAYSGICGTDIHILAGEAPSADSFVMGHEFCGTIYDIGSSVTQFQVGQPVAVNPNNHCGSCEFCIKNQPHYCLNLKPIGVQRNGGWAEYCLAPQDLIFPLPDSMPLAHGALAEPVSCIMHGFDQIQPLSFDTRILILGYGLIGILWSIILRDEGCQCIFISDPNPVRMNYAEALHFSVFNSQQSDRLKSGFDLIIDCSGSPQAIESAFDMLNPTGKFLFFGVCPEDAVIKLSPFKIFRNEWTFSGSFINPHTFIRAIEILAKINMPLETLGVVFYSLYDYEQALQDAKSGKITKGIFRIGN